MVSVTKMQNGVTKYLMVMFHYALLHTAKNTVDDNCNVTKA